MPSTYQPLFKSTIHKYNYYRNMLVGKYGYSYPELYGEKLDTLIEMFNTLEYASSNYKYKEYKPMRTIDVFKQWLANFSNYLGGLI